MMLTKKNIGYSLFRRIKIVLFFSVLTSQYLLANSKQSHFVALNQHMYNAAHVMPGDTIFLESGQRNSLKIFNVKGDSISPIIITNCGGDVLIQNNNIHYGLVISRSSFFRLTGSLDNEAEYGIRILGTGFGGNGLSLDDMSTNYEVDHIEIANSGFAGIFAFTQPTCDLLSNRENFVQLNTIIRDNYIHDTAGEGMYIGHSFYNGYTKDCNGELILLNPHVIDGLKVYNNVLVNTGYDGLQISSAINDAEIYNNYIVNYGTKKEIMQQSGIQIGAGSKVRCYNNIIFSGSGSGIMMFGFADSYIYNNLIVSAGKLDRSQDNQARLHGIFVDDRSTLPNTAHYILNNTIISPKADGIRFNSIISSNNLVANNLILNPGSQYTTYSVENKYINVKQGADVKSLNNYCSNQLLNNLHYDSLWAIIDDMSQIPLQNQGIDVSQFGVRSDLNNKIRNVKPCIGCYEFTNKDIPRFSSKGISIGLDIQTGSVIVTSKSEFNMKYISITDLLGKVIMEKEIDEPRFLHIDLKKHIIPSVYVVTVVVNGEKISGLISTIR